MRIMTDAAVVRVEAMSPALVIRASVEFASACRPVSGQECFGSAATAWQVESASGAGLAGAAGFLGLVALDEGLLERHGYVGLLGQERSRPVQPGTGVSEPGISGDSNNGSDNGSDNDGSKGANGTKPMNPWDFRTSSPPG